MVEQACPAPLPAAVLDLYATVKWQYQTFRKTDEEAEFLGSGLLFMKLAA